MDLHAVEDFGFHGAIDREGNEMTIAWGRRPEGNSRRHWNGSVHPWPRNIYDVSIDPS